MDRRVWLSRTVTAAGLTVAGVLLVPAMLTAVSPVLDRPRTPRWRSIGNLDEFPIGDVVLAMVQRDANDEPAVPKGVFVWRRTVDEVVVYSRNCTDLSCPLTWDGGSGWFYCPCHGGIFTEEGEPVAGPPVGPPSRPMYRYETRVRHGSLDIDLHSLPPMT
jgi:menaquinol-cytochrome c reductase iron-sulfur subunit